MRTNYIFQCNTKIEKRHTKLIHILLPRYIHTYLRVVLKLWFCLYWFSTRHFSILLHRIKCMQVIFIHIYMSSILRLQSINKTAVIWEIFLWDISMYVGIHLFIYHCDHIFAITYHSSLHVFAQLLGVGWYC